MNSFNIEDKDLYIVGAHGCTPANLHPSEDTEEFNKSRFFIVPEGFMLVYLTANGVQSEGRKNIPFIKNLHDYNNELFNYIFNPSNYDINLDKNNPSSYRNSDFFKSLPFFSNFNYLCNFELYPPGVPCPYINLSFSNTCSISTACYFEGITKINNIKDTKFGERLKFNDASGVLNPRIYLENTNGFVYINKFFEILTEKFGIRGGVFFISACRAEFFKNRVKGTYDLVDILPVRRNCGDISYDLGFVDGLISNHPESYESLKNVKKRLEVRNRRKKQIDLIIKQQYRQNTIFYNNNFINSFYSYLNTTNGEINLCVNFSKIKIDSNINTADYKNSLLGMTDQKFYEFRERLQNRQEPIAECNNQILYTKFGYIHRFVFNYITKFNQLPTRETFEFFWNLVNTNWNSDISLDENKTQINTIVNNFSQTNFSFNVIGGVNNSNYQTKYLKYKKKYLELKKIFI